MLLDNLLDLALVEVVGLLILEVQDDLGATAHVLTLGIFGTMLEGAAGSSTPSGTARHRCAWR